MKKIGEGVDIAGPFPFRLYPGSPIYNRLVSAYSIKAPDELSLWEEFLGTEDRTYSDMPWTPVEFRKNFELILFYSTYALYSSVESENQIRRMLLDLLRIFSRYRLRTFQFSVPFEYWGTKMARKVKAALH